MDNVNCGIMERLSAEENEVVARAGMRGYKVNIRNFNPSNLTGTRVECDPYDEQSVASEKNAMNKELIDLQRYMRG
jgi:hypothetical protein